MHISINETTFQSTAPTVQESAIKRAAAQLVALKAGKSVAQAKDKVDTLYKIEQQILQALEALISDLANGNVAGLTKDLENLAHYTYELDHYSAGDSHTKDKKKNFINALQNLTVLIGGAESPIYAFLFGAGNYKSPSEGSIWYIAEHGTKKGWNLTTAIEQMAQRTAENMVLPPDGITADAWKTGLTNELSALLAAIKNESKPE